MASKWMSLNSSCVMFTFGLISLGKVWTPLILQQQVKSGVYNCLNPLNFSIELKANLRLSITEFLHSLNLNYIFQIIFYFWDKCIMCSFSISLFWAIYCICFSVFSKFLWKYVVKKTRWNLKNYMNHLNLSRVILCREVRELCSFWHTVMISSIAIYLTHRWHPKQSGPWGMAMKDYSILSGASSPVAV